MKKEDLLSIVVYLLMLIVALFIGLQIIQPAIGSLGLTGNGQVYGFAVGTIAVGILINVILFEVGHVLGALLGGYKVISINVLGFCFYKTQTKWRFAFSNFEGLTGETKVVARKEKTRPRLFLFGPTLVTLLHFVVALTIFVLTPDSAKIHHQVLIVAGIGTMLLLYNIMPFKLDTFTDGYYFVLLSKRINVEAYNELIRIEALIYENREVTDIKVFEEVTTMTARVTLYRLYQLIDAQKFDEALALIDHLSESESKIEHEFIGRIKAQKLYLILVTKAKEAAEHYWFKELKAIDRKFISNDLTIETMRAYLLYGGLVTKSESECAYVLSRVNRAIKYNVSAYRKDEEKNLFNDAFAKVAADNPVWNLINPLL